VAATDEGAGVSTTPIPIVGVSLGHRHERTGLSVIERAYVPTGETFNAVTYDERGWQRLQTEERLSVKYRVRHLERQGPPSRYKKVARRLPEIVRELARDVLLVLDITAVGHPVYALIWSEISRALKDTQGYTSPTAR
jgi:hypothetical protein